MKAKLKHEKKLILLCNFTVTKSLTKIVNENKRYICIPKGTI